MFVHQIAEKSTSRKSGFRFTEFSETEGHEEGPGFSITKLQSSRAGRGYPAGRASSGCFHTSYASGHSATMALAPPT